MNSNVTQRNCILGRGDSATNANREILSHLARSTSKIPQLDGPIPDPYDDVLSTPNIYNYQGVVNEDYNIVNAPASDVQAATPAPVVQNDAADDDDDDLDDVDQEEELNKQHLVLAQLDKLLLGTSVNPVAHKLYGKFFFLTELYLGMGEWERLKLESGEKLHVESSQLLYLELLKVTRTKSRWKCTLKDGIVHINNKDILFNKANGEFEF
ncbi:hypothetical protein SLEP1_g41497 [Rubroshorea leprosula]|uniref:Uncharacterized protein n=1 Tax=Rubroshorea leprosula TaxID=152421 RepID=A0AAV5L7M3_9ROSI|nr:hypothetical protein SLEP1_g41497 [Rubroshorea leprosula]